MLGIPVKLIDRDVVAVENLGTQGFHEAHLGLSKAEARLRLLAPLNSDCHIVALRTDFKSMGLGALRDARVIFSCLDSIEGRAALNEVAGRLGVPWVDAALDGSGQRLFGRVAAYDPRVEDSACYLCPHDSNSLHRVMRESRRERCPAWTWGAKEDTAPPTLAVSALGSAVAAVQVLWGTKILLNRSAEVCGREIYLDLDQGITTQHALKRNRNCVSEHGTLALTSFGNNVDEFTVAQTFREAEKRLAAGSVSLELHRFSLVLEICCQSCGAVRRPCRILEAMSAAEAACMCGAAMLPQAGGLIQKFRREEAAGFLEKSWADLGLPSQDVITARAGDDELHFLLS
jgi:molybdopterin/thiamine biosynthesis adenylyltransferase